MYRVLIADDEMIERTVLFRTLDKNLKGQCEIFQAENGREALEIYEREHIQILILDIEMPGINGIEAAEQITDVEKRLIRVVVHQAHNCVMIQIENYTEAHRSIDGGLPPTTKGDSTLHGYGLKSIQYIAAKHQGMMAVDCKNNWFILKIMLPIELRAKS